MSAVFDLRTQLQSVGLTYGDLCRETGLSKASVSRIVNTGEYPKRGAAMFKSAITTLLTQAGKHSATEAATKNKTPGTPHAEGLSVDAQSAPTVSPTTIEKEVDMLHRKQSFTQETKKAFKLFRDPFNNDVEEAKDVFLSDDIRYVREAMWLAVRHGGLLAVVGESGSGKSTLRSDVLDRVIREKLEVVMIAPHILAVEDMKSSAIAEAIIKAISPLARLARSAEARYTQLDTLLKNSSRTGKRHVLIIEEAHGLSIETLKNIKRFFELRDGFKEMLAVILVGQPELRQKLAENNPEVREIVQRCDIIELPPLDNHLEAYLKFKFARVGIELPTVFDKGAIDALRSKLTRVSDSTGRARAFGQVASRSFVYPLAVANLVTGAMNLAVSLGAPLVTADLVMEA